MLRKHVDTMYKIHVHKYTNNNRKYTKRGDGAMEKTKANLITNVQTILLAAYCLRKLRKAEMVRRCLLTKLLLPWNFPTFSGLSFPIILYILSYLCKCILCRVLFEMFNMEIDTRHFPLKCLQSLKSLGLEFVETGFWCFL